MVSSARRQPQSDPYRRPAAPNSAGISHHLERVRGREANLVPYSPALNSPGRSEHLQSSIIIRHAPADPQSTYPTAIRSINRRLQSAQSMKLKIERNAAAAPLSVCNPNASSNVEKQVSKLILLL